MSFGIKKCAVLYHLHGHHMPVQQFGLGKNILKPIKSYRYLGVTDQLDDNYSEFLKLKKQSLNARLNESRRVGGRQGGLMHEENRKLYITSVRPIIDFGLSTLPFDKKILSELEKLQLSALRRMFGFRPKTKTESILTLTGVATMTARFAIAKLSMAHKIFTVHSDLYLKVIATANWNGDIGLGADVRALLDHYNNPDLNELCAKLVALDPDLESPIFKNELHKIIDKVDFETRKRALSDSAARNSQASRLYHLFVDSRRGGMPFQLQVHVPRFTAPLYLQVISGCDFLTPLNFQQKITCKFCNRQNTGTWNHLLFECDRKIALSNFEKIIESLNSTDFIEESPKLIGVSKRALHTASRLWNTKNFSELTLFVLAVNLSKLKLNYKHIARNLVSVVCPILYETKKRWESLLPDSDSDSDSSSEYSSSESS